MGNLPAYHRSDILRKTADLLKEKTEDFARILVLEAGKPIRDARGEVGRAVQVLQFAADEAKKIEGELVLMVAAKDPCSMDTWTYRQSYFEDCRGRRCGRCCYKV